MKKKKICRELKLSILLAITVTNSAMAGSIFHSFSNNDFSKGFDIETKLNHSYVEYNNTKYSCHDIGKAAPAEATVDNKVLYKFVLTQSENVKDNSGVSAVFYNGMDKTLKFSDDSEFYVKTDLNGTGNNSLNALTAYSGNLVFDGNAKFTAIAQGENGKSAYGLAIFDVNGYATAKFYGENLDVSLQTDTARLYSENNKYCEAAGIYSYKSDIITSSDTKTNIFIVGTSSSDNATPVYGILSEAGMVDLQGDTKIKVMSAGGDSSIINPNSKVAAGTAVGVKVINGFYNTTSGTQSGFASVNLNNVEIEVKNSGDKGKAIGLETSEFLKDNNQVQLQVNGNVAIDVEGAESSGVEIKDSTNAVIGNDTSNISIVAKSTKNDEYAHSFLASNGSSMQVKGDNINLYGNVLVDNAVFHETSKNFDLKGNFIVRNGGSSEVYFEKGVFNGDVIADKGKIALQGSDNTVNGVIQSKNDGIVSLNGTDSVYNLQHMEAASGGKIKVGASTTINVDSMYVSGENYLAVVENDSSLEVASDAKLRILNAEKGQEFNIVQGSNETKWLLKNISADNFMLQYEQKEDSSDYIITTVVADAAEVFDGAVIIPKALTQNLRLADKGDAAFDFFTAVTDSNNFTKEQAINAINSAADMHELGGVNHAAYSVHNAMTDAVADHLSLAVHEHDGHEHDKDIWAHYIHNKENIRGMNLGGLNANYDLQYNGIVVGSDLYNKGKAVAGLALSYADGSVNSGTASSHTRNEADYYGISLYGRIKNGGSALLGDISYMHGSNDLTQHNSGHDITASVKTDAFSVGVKAEQEFKTGAGRVVPYAGLRYMHLGAGSYTNSLGLHYDADDQNLLLLPVGVAYSCELKTGSWSFRPVIDLGYVWTMGDREADMTVSLNGASDGFGFNTADSGSFVSRFALEAEKNNITYGLCYEYQKGDSVKANKWLANLTVSF